ncbi:MAG: thioredoxin [Patescibacteria group bacterium]
MALELNSKNFNKEVMESKEPVLVDFWASWCGPCKMMAPVVEELSGEMKGIKIAKLNIEDEEQIANNFGIMSIPSFLIFKNGKVTDQASGVMPKEKLASFIKNAIK